MDESEVAAGMRGHLTFCDIALKQMPLMWQIEFGVSGGLD